MKKNISLLLVLVLSLFIGIGIASATKLPGTIQEKYDCKDEGTVGGKHKTTCTIKFTANQTTTISGSEQWEIKYITVNSMSDWEFVSDGELGVTSNREKTTDGGTFTFNFQGNVEKGTTYELFTFSFFADPSLNGDQCGGYVYPVDNGQTTGGDKTSTIGEKDTGVSVPVAIIGIGAVTGLAIYSVSSKKTKMHRI